MSDQVLEIALSVVTSRYAELVTAMLEGKSLSRGEMMRHAAYIPRKYQTQPIAAVMQKKR